MPWAVHQQHSLTTASSFSHSTHSPGPFGVPLGRHLTAHVGVAVRGCSTSPSIENLLSSGPPGKTWKVRRAPPTGTIASNLIGCSKRTDASIFNGNLPGLGRTTCGGGSGKVRAMNEPGVSIGSRVGLAWTPKTLIPIYAPVGSFADGSTATITEIDIMPPLRTRPDHSNSFYPMRKRPCA